jgi:xylulokinase
MLEAGVNVTAMRACGGPARSDAWNQIKADVTGFPVLVPSVLETAVLGSAILGAVAIGARTDIRSAIAAMTRIERALEPDPETSGVYDRTFAAYAALHPAIAPVMRPLAPVVEAS